MKTTITNIKFAPKPADMDSSDYEALKGLTLFLNAKDLVISQNPDPNQLHPGSFCYQMRDLFDGLNGFVSSRFKEDRHIQLLKMAYDDSINVKPWLADKYFYAYSELMELLIGLYNASSLIDQYSTVFHELTEKEEYFEIESVSLRNSQPVI